MVTVLPRYAYASALSACRRSGQWQYGLQVFQAAKDSSAISLNQQIYGAALGALSVGSAWNLALELLTDMSESDLAPNLICYACMLDAVVTWQAVGRWLSFSLFIIIGWLPISSS